MHVAREWDLKTTHLNKLGLSGHYNDNRGKLGPSTLSFFNTAKGSQCFMYDNLVRLSWTKSGSERTEGSGREHKVERQTTRTVTGLKEERERVVEEEKGDSPHTPPPTQDPVSLSSRDSRVLSTHLPSYNSDVSGDSTFLGTYVMLRTSLLPRRSSLLSVRSLPS